MWSRRSLARGDEVHVVDDLSKGKREQVPAAATLHVHDIREPLDAIVRESGAQAIVHLAAQADVRVSVGDPAFDAAVNVLGTVNVLEAARLVGARVVFASTGGAIYGECERPARESDPCLPLSPYGAAKLAGEGYLGAFARLYGAPHVSLRFGNVYGPRQDPHGEAGVVAIFLGRLRDGSRAGSSATGRRAATTSTSRTWSARPWPRSMETRAACSTSAPASQRRCWSSTTSAGRPSARTPRPSMRLPGRASSAEACSTVTLAATTLGFRPEIALAAGIAMTWESIRSDATAGQ